MDNETVVNVTNVNEPTRSYRRHEPAEITATVGVLDLWHGGRIPHDRAVFMMECIGWDRDEINWLLPRP